MNGRSWKFVLVGSVVLNVFLLGAIAGGTYQWFAFHRAPFTAHGPRVALRFAAQALPPERRQQFVDALRAARRKGRPYAREAREGRREVLGLLAAPTLDRAALDAALARTRAADSALRAQIEAGVADFATTLTPQERIQFVDGLRHRGQWRLPPRAQRAPRASE